MTTAPSSTFKVLHVAVLSVETLASGRSKVTYRTAKSEANPSGIETAHTALLTTEEGRSASAVLRGSTRTWPMTLLRTTPVGLAVETLADGSTLRIISEALPTPAREDSK
jgi:hypothetical protein